MAQLIQMRQRMKAIQVIKKITHAMRLISMSNHSRMTHQETSLKLYQETIQRLFLCAKQTYPNYYMPLLYPIDKTSGHTLIILIGSQKGLCGSFNMSLFQLFRLQMRNQPTYNIITVGRRATQYIQKNNLGSLLAFYDNFGLHNMLTIADNLLQEIIQSKKIFSSVIIYSNSAPSFFVQKPIVRQIIPAAELQSQDTAEYEWEQTPQEVISYLANQYLLSQIQYALFQSLYAEQAARFVSMDSSTRNAEILLEQMQRDYNKLRQAKITRELTELSSFFLV